MMSGWFLVLLGVCGLVGVQAQNNQTPEKTTEEDLRGLVQQLTARVQKLEKDREATAASQVAFSASLVNTNGEWTFLGPYDTDSTLVFQKVMTNVGNAYNPNTGIFTAPVRGLYYIRFTGMTGNSKSLNAALMKNGQNMFAIYDTMEPHSSASNGMTLVLEQGDRLWITLWAGKSIFDQGRLSTFSGFLVFTLGAEPETPAMEKAGWETAEAWLNEET